MAKGDWIQVGIITGDAVIDRVIKAQQNGRKVAYEFEKDGTIQWLKVTEETRGGTVVEELRVPADQIAYFHKKEV